MSLSASSAPETPNFGGAYPAKVYSISDPNHANRIQMYIPQIFGAAPVKIWAPPLMAGGSPPSVGAVVWCLFQGGDPAYPTYLPSIPASSSGSGGAPYYQGWVPGGGYGYSMYMPNDQLFVGQYSHPGDLIAQPLYVPNPMPSSVAVQQIGFYGKGNPPSAPSPVFRAGLYQNLGAAQGSPYWVGPNYPGTLVHDFGSMFCSTSAGLGRVLSTGSSYQITSAGLYWIVVMGQANLVYGQPLFVTTWGGSSPWNDPMQEYGQSVQLGNTPVTGNAIPSLGNHYTGFWVSSTAYSGGSSLPGTFPLVTNWTLLPAADCPWLFLFT